MSIDRRTFLKMSGAALAAVPIVHRMLPVTAYAAAAADLPMTKETDEPAKSLKYCVNADQPKACAARKDKAKSDQYCYSCQLFTGISGEKKSAVGKCMIMPKSHVSGGAWCQSWVKKPS